jgi:hypothetical protein
LPRAKTQNPAEKKPKDRARQLQRISRQRARIERRVAAARHSLGVGILRALGRHSGADWRVRWRRLRANCRCKDSKGYRVT